MYAVIVTGGKQYRVSQGDVIYVEKLDQEVGSKVSFDVLMLGNEDSVEIGTPTLAGAKVEGTIAGQVKGEKILIYKYKSKKNYHRRAGHRDRDDLQPLALVRGHREEVKRAPLAVGGRVSEDLVLNHLGELRLGNPGEEDVQNIHIPSFQDKWNK